MKRYQIIHLSFFLFIIFLAGCVGQKESPIEKNLNTAETLYESSVHPLITDLSDTSVITYSLHEIEIDPYGDMFPCRQQLSDEKFFYPLQSGCWAYTVNVQPVRPLLEVEKDKTFQIIRWIPSVMTTIQPDGSAPEMETITRQSPYTMFLAFDTGDIISSRYNGKNVYRNGELFEEFEDKNKQWFTGIALRDNQYFRICNSHEKMSYIIETSQWSSHTPLPHYALFYYMERLTEFKYFDLYASAFAFVGLYYDENEVLHTDILNSEGEILRTEAADLSSEYPEVKNKIEYDGLSIAKDEATGLYYYANADGDAVCEPAFTDCSNIKNGTAVVQIRETRFMLVVNGTY